MAPRCSIKMRQTPKVPLEVAVGQLVEFSIVRWGCGAIVQGVAAPQR